MTKIEVTCPWCGKKTGINPKKVKQKCVHCEKEFGFTKVKKR